VRAENTLKRGERQIVQEKARGNLKSRCLSQLSITMTNTCGNRILERKGQCGLTVLEISVCGQPAPLLGNLWRSSTSWQEHMESKTTQLITRQGKKARAGEQGPPSPSRTHP
jgi:hypothetical protein